MKKTKKKNDHKLLKEIGLITAGLAATVAGVYFITSDKGKKVRGWALKFKGEVLEELESVKGNINKENFEKIIDEVGKRYRQAQKVGGKEIEALSANLKRHWKDIKTEASKSGGVSGKKVKRAASKAKKTAKKTLSATKRNAKEGISRVKKSLS